MKADLGRLRFELVPVKDKQAVVDVEGIPEGDDYFCVFMDSYDGTVSDLSDLSHDLKGGGNRGVEEGDEREGDQTRRRFWPPSLKFTHARADSLSLLLQVYARSSKFSIQASS